MARNEEKAQGLMNRWTQMKQDIAAPLRGKRPYLASKCDSLSDCEFWRRQIVKEIQKLVGDIQNAGLGEHALRDMNDTINKKLREKRHWERQIKKLGGPNYGSQPTIFDADGKAVRRGGYLYFGATKDLPGVRELFQKAPPKKARRSRREIFRNINSDYYGYRDEDDGVVLAAEQAAEAKLKAKRAAQQAAGARKRPRVQDSADGKDAAKGGEEAQNEASSEDEEVDASDPKQTLPEDATTSAAVRAHVPVPDQEAIEKLILARRRMELLAKYASSNLVQEEKSAKTLLNVRR